MCSSRRASTRTTIWKTSIPTTSPSAATIRNSSIPLVAGARHPRTRSPTETATFGNFCEKADKWLPSKLPGNADYVDLTRLAQSSYTDALFDALIAEMQSSAAKLDVVTDLIWTDYSRGIRLHPRRTGHPGKRSGIQGGIQNVLQYRRPGARNGQIAVQRLSDGGSQRGTCQLRHRARGHQRRRDRHDRRQPRSRRFGQFRKHALPRRGDRQPAARVAVSRTGTEKHGHSRSVPEIRRRGGRHCGDQRDRRVRGYPPLCRGPAAAGGRRHDQHPHDTHGSTIRARASATDEHPIEINLQPRSSTEV